MKEPRRWTNKRMRYKGKGGKGQRKGEKERKRERERERGLWYCLSTACERLKVHQPV